MSPRLSIDKPEVVIGFDPGATGGTAIIGVTTAIAEAWRFPGDATTQAQLIAEIQQKYTIVAAGLEKVGARPGQGVRSMFSFGQRFGELLGIIAMMRVPLIVVTPQRWQKACLDSGTGDTKQRSLGMARRLYPKVDLRYKKDDGKADALHIAQYTKGFGGLT